MYQERTYRKIMGQHLTHFLLSEEESDLWIGLPSLSIETELITDARHHLIKHRTILKKYIDHYPVFQSTLQPYQDDKAAPLFIQSMIDAGVKANVGPMAAVAGAFSKITGDFLKDQGVSSFLVENGGDILVFGFPDITIAINAGDSIYTNSLGIKIKTDGKEMGICSSSGTFGHSFSFGKADLVTVIAEDIYLADAYATSLANSIQTAEDIHTMIKIAETIDGLSGVLMIKDETVGLWGNFELVKI